MSQKNHDLANQGFRHEGHKLVSRRDFLGQGLVAGAAFVAAPSLLGFLSPERASAQAALDCGIAVGGAGKIPFLCIDLAGGASTSGSNVLVGGPAGQLDPLDDEGYEKLGLPTGMFPTDPAQVNTELGLAFHADSAFLRGIQDKTSAATRANVNGTIFCARSSNDTGDNPHNPLFGINRAGANGDLVGLIGTDNSPSGGNSDAPMSMFDPSMVPSKVESSNDARGLVDTGLLADMIGQDGAIEVMKSVERLSAAKVQNITEGQVVKDLINCAYAQSTDLTVRYGDPNILDPNLDPEIVGQGGSIFTMNELNGESKFRKTAAVMKLVQNGFAGAGCVEMGGYDYHNGTRATGEVRDFQAGQCMGAMLEYAARMGRPLCLYVFSDGSVAAGDEIDNTNDGRGKFVWRGDNSTTAGTFMLVYDPNGRPQLTDPTAAQIGHFRMNGSLETAATRVSQNVALLAEAVVLNYLALHDELGLFEQALPGHGLGDVATRDGLTAFQPIV